jgi:hypothetical protein
VSGEKSPESDKDLIDELNINALLERIDELNPD